MFVFEVGNVVVNNRSRVVGYDFGDGRGYVGKIVVMVKVRLVGSVRLFRSRNDRGSVIIIISIRKFFEEFRLYGFRFVGVIFVY